MQDFHIALNGTLSQCHITAKQYDSLKKSIIFGCDWLTAALDLHYNSVHATTDQYRQIITGHYTNYSGKIIWKACSAHNN